MPDVRYLTVCATPARIVRMELRIAVEPIDRLDDHALIPIAFAVERVLAVSLEGSGLGGIRLSETGVDVPRVKDYDLIKGKRADPVAQAIRYVQLGSVRVIRQDRAGRRRRIVVNTAGVHMLDRAPGTAVLWDSGCVLPTEARGSVQPCSEPPRTVAGSDIADT